jgi:hypothetical protein
MYAPIRDSLMASLGKPFWGFRHLGDPRGFTVARQRRGARKSDQLSMNWAKLFRQEFADDFGVDHLIATKVEPLFIYTEAYFRGGVHCDPENVHKLAKDSLFYNTPAGKGAADKYTGGCYAGPLYDKENPRTDMFIWKL